MPFAASPEAAPSATIPDWGQFVAMRKLMSHVRTMCVPPYLSQAEKTASPWTNREASIRTDEEVVGCRVKVLEGAVEPQRHPTLLAIHVRLACFAEALSYYRVDKAAVPYEEVAATWMRDVEGAIPRCRDVSRRDQAGPGRNCPV